MSESAAKTSFATLALLLLRHWPYTIGFALAGAVLGIAVAFLIPPVYRAEATVVPVKDDSLTAGLGSLASQFGGLMSLAGVSLPGAQDRNEAIATLRSREIALRLIHEQNMLQRLFASKWDPVAKQWRGRAPTNGDALDRFQRKVLAVRDDTKTGLVTVDIDWHDREEAARWANRIVALANEVSQTRAVNEAEQSIEHLQREAKAADSVEVREAVFHLIEQQLKNKTVAEVRRDYAFRIIDPALVPEERRYIWPRKDVLAIAGLIFGGAAGLLFLWLRARRTPPDTAHG